MPTAKDAGTMAIGRSVVGLSLYVSETIVCSGVAGSAVELRNTPGETSWFEMNLPFCASDPKRPEARA